MPDPVQASRFSDLARDAQALCREFERGQASMPLADHFGTLADGLADAVFTVAVVAQDRPSRDEALGWLLGEPQRRVSVLMDRGRGLLDIRLHDRGWGLQDAGDAERQFDTLEQLLQALWDTPDAGPSDGAEPLRVRLPALGTGPGMALLVVLADGDGMLPAGSFATLAARCQLLVTAGTEAPPVPLAEAWGELARGIGCLWPLAIGTAGPSAPTWARSLGSGVTLLAAATAVPGEVTAWPSPLGDAFATLRPPLLLAAQLRRMQLALDALRERCDQDQRRAQGQRQREDAATRAEPQAGDATVRKPFEAARAALQDEAAALTRALQDSARRSLLPDGAVVRGLSGQLDALCAEDLTREVGAKTIRLSLSADFQGHLQRVLRKALKSDLAADLRTLGEGLEVLKTRLEGQLEAGTGAPVSLVLPAASESDIWNRMGELTGVEIRYQGELPRRGLMQRLGEGRRMVFGVMMVLSLVGSTVGFSLRGIGLIGIGFLLLFLGGVVYTFRAWRGEDEERVGNELERVREQLNQECRRMAAEAQREKQQQLAEHLEQVRRLWGARIEELQRDRLAAQAEAVAQQRDRARTRLRRIEQQQRDLSTAATRIARMKQDCGTLATEVARALREAADRAGAIRRAA